MVTAITLSTVILATDIPSLKTFINIINKVDIKFTYEII